MSYRNFEITTKSFSIGWRAYLTENRTFCRNNHKTRPFRTEAETIADAQRIIDEMLNWEARRLPKVVMLEQKTEGLRAEAKALYWKRLRKNVNRAPRAKFVRGGKCLPK